MKKIIYNFITTLSLLSLFAVSAQAEAVGLCYDPFCTDNLISSGTGLGTNDPISIASGIINFGLSVLGMLCLVLIIYAGYKWMMARGNESEVEKAIEILKGSIIGLIIILASYAITYYVFNNLVNISSGDQTSWFGE